MKDIKTRIKENEKFEPSLTPPFPGNMLVELTNACNHKCVFCGNKKKARNIGHIKEDVLDRILIEAYSLGTRNLGFYTTGEPFLSPKLEKFIARAKDIGYDYVYIDTNGALATPERAVKAIEAGLDSVKFSINAGTAETYKAIHGFNDFDRVINHLKFINDFRKKHGKPFKIYASYVVSKQNQSECQQLKKLIGHLVDDIVFNNLVNQGGMMVDENISMSTTENKPAREPPCSMLFNRVHTTWEGYLTACCVDFGNNLVVADLNKTSLKDAWLCERFKDLRKRHLTNSLQGTLCYNCLFNKNEPFTQLWKP